MPRPSLTSHVARQLNERVGFFISWPGRDPQRKALCEATARKVIVKVRRAGPARQRKAPLLPAVTALIADEMEPFVDQPLGQRSMAMIYRDTARLCIQTIQRAAKRSS